MKSRSLFTVFGRLAVLVTTCLLVLFPVSVANADTLQITSGYVDFIGYNGGTFNVSTSEYSLSGGFFPGPELDVTPGQTLSFVGGSGGTDLRIGGDLPSYYVLYDWPALNGAQANIMFGASVFVPTGTPGEYYGVGSFEAIVDWAPLPVQRPPGQIYETTAYGQGIATLTVVSDPSSGWPETQDLRIDFYVPEPPSSCSSSSPLALSA